MTASPATRRRAYTRLVAVAPARRLPPRISTTSVDANDAEPADGFAHGEEAIGDGGGKALLQLVIEMDSPGGTGGDLLTMDGARPSRLAACRTLSSGASVVGSVAMRRGIFR
jgi:hypothetical protein